jgi:hypothetical protein
VTPNPPNESPPNEELPLAERMEALRSNLDLVAEFEASGTPYSELNEHGEVVVN